MPIFNPEVTKDPWQPWHDEMKRYAARETVGITKNLAALEAHIKKLREVCPKDAYHLSNYLKKFQIRLYGLKGYLTD